MNENMMRRMFNSIGLASLVMVTLHGASNAAPKSDQSLAKVQPEKSVVFVKADAQKEFQIAAAAQDNGDGGEKKKRNAGRSPDKVYKEDGKYFLKDSDLPTYNQNEEGKWDWLTFNGNRRYHAECHVCHGPLGLGSSFAPALAKSLKTLSYEQFREVVVNGRIVPQADGSANSMPSFGNNKNVACFLDDFYVYLKARADGALGKIAHTQMKKEAKSDEIREEEAECFDG